MNRARHALAEPTAIVVPDPNIATILPRRVTNLACMVVTNTEKQEKPVASRLKGKDKVKAQESNDLTTAVDK